jgi:hypothetical protein
MTNAGAASPILVSSTRNCFAAFEFGGIDVVEQFTPNPNPYKLALIGRLSTKILTFIFAVQVPEHCLVSN